MVIVPSYPFGDREFYREPVQGTRIFREMNRLGLETRKTAVGFGELKIIGARRMYELGMRALRAKPDIMLCGRPDYVFCPGYRKQLAGGSCGL